MSRHRVVQLGIIALTWVGLSTAAFAQKNLGETYTDADYGYQIQLPNKWKQIPVQPGEKSVIAKFVGPQVDINLAKQKEEGNFYDEPQLEIIRIVPRKKADVVTGVSQTPKPETGDPDGTAHHGEGEEKTKTEEPRRDQAPQSFEDWLNKTYGAKGIRIQTQGKKIKVGKREGEEMVYLTNAYKIDQKNYALVVQLDDEAFAMHYRLANAPNGFDKWEDVFQRSARSFRETNKKKVAEPASTKVDSNAPLPDAEKKRHLADVSRTAGWYLDETKNYFIKARTVDQNFVQTLKEHLEMIRGRLEADYPPIKPITTRSVLRVCHDWNEYTRYGGPGGSVGYWNPGTEELVVFNSKEYDIKATYAVLYHEAFHQYIFYRCGKISPHSWFNEGTGDFYAGGKIKYGKFEIGPSEAPLVGRVETARSLVQQKKTVPLEKLVRMTQAEYYTEGALKYAQGWALIYFLRNGSSANGWKKEWEQILPTYLQVLIDTKNPEKAVEKAFDGVDMNALESTWLEYVKRL